MTLHIIANVSARHEAIDGQWKSQILSGIRKSGEKSPEDGPSRVSPFFKYLAVM